MPRLPLLLLLCLATPPALGWGRDAHRIVAELAQRQLTPAAGAEVSRLLAGEPEPSLAGVANWADDIRKADPRDPRSRWHYVNFRNGDCDYLPERDCPDGACVIGAIEREVAVLADRARTDADRRDALKFLAHFVADVHQPLHATPRSDKGGSEFQVNLEGRGTNLHLVWDYDIVPPEGVSAQAHAEQLAARPTMSPDPIRGDAHPARAWALESCRIVADGAIDPAGHKLDGAYLQAQRPLAERRLRQAGERLAATLNAALAPAPAP
jgi:hypothetical protein